MRKLTLLFAFFIAFQLNAQTGYPGCSVCWATVTVNETGSTCLINWAMNSVGLIDDDTAEDYFAWTVSDGYTSVKYTYPGYPIRITGGEIYVGDGSYPSGSDFIGKQFRACVFDDDGPNGLPGTLLDSVTVTVTDYHWVAFDGLDATIADGEFYMAMQQLADAPDCPPTGVDLFNMGNHMSYVKAPGGEWELSSYQNFMIRYFACTPMETVTEKSHERNTLGTTVALVTDFDTLAGEGPEEGTLVLLDSNIDLYHSYEFAEWDTLNPGYYAFAVKTYCWNNTESDWEYTGVVVKSPDALPGWHEVPKLLLYPNPFTGSAFIEFELEQLGEVNLSVYNHLGKQVETIRQLKPRGKQKMLWHAEGLPAGMYYFKFQTGDQSASGKMLLMK